MESLSSESKGIALDILEDILSAIERLEDRTKDVQTIDDFLCFFRLKCLIIEKYPYFCKNFSSH